MEIVISCAKLLGLTKYLFTDSGRQATSPIKGKGGDGELVGDLPDIEWEWSWKESNWEAVQGKIHQPFEGVCA